MTVLELTLTLAEPVLVSKPGGDPNTLDSYAYLPGSAIRGAVIGAYLNATDDYTLDFDAVFLSGQCRFLNAYPVLDDQRTIPIPTALVQDKNSPAGTLKNRNVAVEGVAPKSVKASFGSFSDTNYSLTTPINTVKIHNQRSRKHGTATRDEGAVFKYAALDAEQLFKSYIVTDSTETCAQLQSLITTKMQHAWLGGAKSAGYGKVSVSVEPAKNWPEVATAETEIPADTTFTVTLLSDTITRNAYGQTGSYLKEALGEVLGVTLETQQTYVRKTHTGGFNGKWGLQLQQVWAIQAGGSYAFSADAPISADQIKALHQSGIGERTAEGYGSLAINWALPEEYMASPANEGLLNSKQTDSRNLQMPAQALSDAQQSMVNDVAVRIAEQRLADAALRNAMAVKLQNAERIDNTQLGNLQLVLQGCNLSKDVSELAKWVENVGERSVARKQFEAVRVTLPTGHNLSLLGWLSELANAKDIRWSQIVNNPDDQLEALLPTVNGMSMAVRQSALAQLDLTYTLRLVTAVIKQIRVDTLQ